MSEENALTGSEQPASPKPEEPGQQAVETEAAVQATDEGTTEPEPQEAKPEDSEDDKPKPKKSRYTERVEELARRDRNHRRTIARLNQEIGKLKAEKPLSPEDFASDAEYQAAHFKRAAKEAGLESQYEGVRLEAEEIATQRQQAWGDIVLDAKQSMPDFEQVFDQSVPVSEAMADVIMDSDSPGHLAYWLGKNRAEARRIAEMQPMQAARALGLIEARLAAPKVKTVSSAPKPPPTLTGKGSAPTVKNLHELAKGGEDATAFIEESRRRERAKLGA